MTMGSKSLLLVTQDLGAVSGVLFAMLINYFGFFGVINNPLVTSK